MPETKKIYVVYLLNLPILINWLPFVFNFEALLMAFLKFLD